MDVPERRGGLEQRGDSPGCPAIQDTHLRALGKKGKPIVALGAPEAPT
jgi:hypothetical protein